MFHSNSKGIQPIIPGLSNVQGINMPLITFDSIMDIDFGLMLYIDKFFLDPTIFDVEFFNSHHTIKTMIKTLLYREEENPLSLCVRKDALEKYKDIDSKLYNDFMTTDKHYEKILGLSMYTNLREFISLSVSTGKEVRPTIICKSEFEKEFVKKNISKSVPVLILNEIGKVDYQQFFFKHVGGEYTDALIEKIGIDKSVYLANYKFNDIERIKESVFLAALTVNYNRISMYDPYNRELFEEEENDND